MHSRNVHRLSSKHLGTIYISYPPTPSILQSTHSLDPDHNVLTTQMAMSNKSMFPTSSANVVTQHSGAGADNVMASLMKDLDSAIASIPTYALLSVPLAPRPGPRPIGTSRFAEHLDDEDCVEYRPDSADIASAAPASPEQSPGPIYQTFTSERGFPAHRTMRGRGCMASVTSFFSRLWSSSKKASEQPPVELVDQQPFSELPMRMPQARPIDAIRRKQPLVQQTFKLGCYPGGAADEYYLGAQSAPQLQSRPTRKGSLSRRRFKHFSTVVEFSSESPAAVAIPMVQPAQDRMELSDDEDGIPLVRSAGQRMELSDDEEDIPMAQPKSEHFIVGDFDSDDEEEADETPIIAAARPHGETVSVVYSGEIVAVVLPNNRLSIITLAPTTGVAKLSRTSQVDIVGGVPPDQYLSIITFASTNGVAKPSRTTPEDIDAAVRVVNDDYVDGAPEVIHRVRRSDFNISDPEESLIQRCHDATSLAELKAAFGITHTHKRDAGLDVGDGGVDSRLSTFDFDANSYRYRYASTSDTDPDCANHLATITPWDLLATNTPWDPLATNISWDYAPAMNSPWEPLATDTAWGQTPSSVTIDPNAYCALLFAGESEACLWRFAHYAEASDAESIDQSLFADFDGDFADASSSGKVAGIAPYSMPTDSYTQTT
ncbi:hypothetical protein CC86DRAFT_438704 [Ophiobolus disseminans]|uniref:Uncharacterized protein n=1 Tax=Ophiobolus disseminans TaxID=1469910 RepID=A0A6A7A5B1_9PLEO|nr:hypothetical protein CC86DRAFT_438704 [Ophiobolus disseminans]